VHQAEDQSEISISVADTVLRHVVGAAQCMVDLHAKRAVVAFCCPCGAFRHRLLPSVFAGQLGQ